MASRNRKVHYSAGSFTFVDYKKGLVVWPRLGDPFVWQEEFVCLYVSFSRTDSGSYKYLLFVSSNCNFLHNSQSFLVLCSFCANLIRLIVSSLSPYYLYLFCCILSILALIGFVLMALFCAAISRFNFSLKISFS